MSATRVLCFRFRQAQQRTFGKILLSRLLVLLQVLGYETDAVNSVQFSNHTGYSGGFKGTRMDDVQLGEILEGLEANNLDDGYSHVITGYVGTPTFLRALAKTVRDLKAKSVRLTHFSNRTGLGLPLTFWMYISVG